MKRLWFWFTEHEKGVKCPVYNSDPETFPKKRDVEKTYFYSWAIMIVKGNYGVHSIVKRIHTK